MKNQLELPAIQKSFINQFDGTLKSVVQFENLSTILNPCFTSHYFYISGNTPATTLTTRDTDGSFAYNGIQSEEAITNAYELAKEVRRFLMARNPLKLSEVVKDHEELRSFNKKISRVKNNACFFIDGQLFIVKGLKLN